MLHKHFKTSKCALGASYDGLLRSRLAKSDDISGCLEANLEEYKCATCDRTFHDLSFLELHIISSCIGTPVKQEYTPEYSSSSEKLGTFLCGICQRESCTENELVSHVQLIHGDTAIANACEEFPDYICGRCNSVFDLGNDLAVHLKTCFNGNSSELDIETFSCGICKADFRSAAELECHISVHTQSEYLCGQCGQAFDSSDVLVNHFLIEHSDNKACVVVNSPEGYSNGDEINNINKIV